MAIETTGLMQMFFLLDQLWKNATTALDYETGMGRRGARSNQPAFSFLRFEELQFGIVFEDVGVADPRRRQHVAGRQLHLDRETHKSNLDCPKPINRTVTPSHIIKLKQTRQRTVLKRQNRRLMERVA